MDKRDDDSTQTEQPYDAPAIQSRQILEGMLRSSDRKSNCCNTVN